VCAEKQQIYNIHNNLQYLVNWFSTVRTVDLFYSMVKALQQIVVVITVQKK